MPDHIASAGSNMVAVPSIALSVHQPWAWAIIHGGKDVENRSLFAIRKGNMTIRRIAIHASKTMTRSDYHWGASFMARVGVTCPAPADLRRGGIIGAVDVVAFVRTMQSPWFVGPRGLVLKNPQACAFVPAPGDRGFFRWVPGGAEAVPPTAKWMLPSDETPMRSGTEPPQAMQLEMF